MRAVFDLDDTLCYTENRDYENSRPNTRAVGVLRNMKEQGWEITIHTSRGMASCKGDVAKAEERNRPVIEAWLKRNGVPYDEIVFGKPLADVYVDDKAVNIRTFEERGCALYGGFSGARVARVGDVIIKEGKGLEAQGRWLREQECRKGTGVRVPKVLSFQLGKLYMEYIDGEPLSYSRRDWKDISDILYAIAVFATFKECKPNEWGKYLQMVGSRAEKAGIECDGLLRDLSVELEKYRERTMCHGDMTLLNVIEDGRTGEKVYIDPSVKEYASHWLLDISKLRASLNGLDCCIDGRSVSNRHLLLFLDEYIRERGCERVVGLLEKTHYLRVIPFAIERGDRKAERKLMDLYYGR